MKLAHSRTMYAAKYKPATAHFEARSDKWGCNHSLCSTRAGMSLSGTGYQLSGRRIWSGSPLNAILADRRHADLFDSRWSLNVQVRVYDQPEDPAVPRRAPMLFGAPTR